jgi:hypothetical protein
MVQELRSLWNSFPNRAAFGVLLAAWLALFHFLGNSTLGYIPTESMFGWLQAVYEGGARLGRDDELGLVIPWLVGAIIFVRRTELTAVLKEAWAPAPTSPCAWPTTLPSTAGSRCPTAAPPSISACCCRWKRTRRGLRRWRRRSAPARLRTAP